MTSEALPDERGCERRRREAVATADRVFAALVEEVRATSGRRGAALRPWAAAPGAVGGAVGGAVNAAVPASADAAAPSSPDPPGGRPVELTGRPGASVTTSLWVHNLRPAAVSGLRLRLTALATDDGAVIAASHGTLLPARVDVGPTASAEVCLTVVVPGDAVRGEYHGHVQGEGPPDAAAVPVRLVVGP